MGSRSPDRLSILPVEIILHIFSFIPNTEEIARTSGLSRRFRGLWAHLPSLCLGHSKTELPSIRSGDHAALSSYVHSVDACFASFRSPTLDSLALLLPAGKPSARSNRWIRFAAARSIRRLRLRRLQSKGDAVVSPSIFACEKLSSLDLKSCSLPKTIPLNFQGFRFLTDLNFSYGSISDETFASLLSRCPSLQTLSLFGSNLTNFEVSSGSLKHLRIGLCLNLYRATFDAPNLESVHFTGDLKVLSLKRSEMLRDAQIRHWCCGPNVGYDQAAEIDHENWERSLLELAHTSQTLEVNKWVFQFELGGNMTSIFKNLKELRYVTDWVTAPVLGRLVSMLHHCLSLEKLYVDLLFGSRSDFVFRKQVIDELRQLDESRCASVREAVPPLKHEDVYPEYRECFDKDYKVDEEREIWDPSECASGDYVDSTLGLKSIVINAFLGTANEMKLLEFLLSKASILETLTISDCQLRRKQGISQLLADIPRASPLVQICEMELSRF